MSSLPIPSAITSTLPAANIHPHGHGHKKGATALDPTADSSSGTAQVPAGSMQNLFGSLFNSLARLIGIQPVPATPNPAISAGNAAASSVTAGAAAAGAKINVMA
jgi:hypothetical protein